LDDLRTFGKKKPGESGGGAKTEAKMYTKPQSGGKKKNLEDPTQRSSLKKESGKEKKEH